MHLQAPAKPVAKPQEAPKAHRNNPLHSFCKYSLHCRTLQVSMLHRATLRRRRTAQAASLSLEQMPLSIVSVRLARMKKNVRHPWMPVFGVFALRRSLPVSWMWPLKFTNSGRGVGRTASSCWSSLSLQVPTRSPGNYTTKQCNPTFCPQGRFHQAHRTHPHQDPHLEADC